MGITTCQVNLKLGFKFFITFVDDYSRRTLLYLMKDCSKVLSIFKKFGAEIKNQFDTSVRILKSDNINEFFSSSFVDFYVTVWYSPPIFMSLCSLTKWYCKTQNRHSLEVTCTLLIHMRIPKVLGEM